jgi:hypothetical protein
MVGRRQTLDPSDMIDDTIRNFSSTYAHYATQGDDSRLEGDSDEDTHSASGIDLGCVDNALLLFLFWMNELKKKEEAGGGEVWATCGDRRVGAVKLAADTINEWAHGAQIGQQHVQAAKTSGAGAAAGRGRG